MEWELSGNALLYCDSLGVATIVIVKVLDAHQYFRYII